jgi:hypothetical protein
LAPAELLQGSIALGITFEFWEKLGSLILGELGSLIH